MAVAGMILGIVAVIFAFIPVAGAFIAFPCLAVGLPLSAVGFFRNRSRGEGKGMAITGIVTNVVAFVFVVLWITVLASAS